ncbi:hypothetical protein ACJPQX_20750 [Vibrio vulnificus]|uniref:hypothetical protein n=1 Tax=Vibrio vulnificus TaxID=672 RepID=UPI003D9CBAE6
MDFDSLFDDAMRVADQAVEDVMASEFRLLLRDGSNLDIKAIFDTNLEHLEEKNRPRSLIVENGTLTVLNQRVDKDLVYAASVVTSLGTRYVASVEYPDATTTLLILTTKPQSNTVAASDNFL